MRCSVSPAFRASAVCILRQLAQPLIWDARILTSSSSDFSMPLSPTCIEKAYQALKRSEEHTSELQSLMRISYAVFCLKKKTKDPNRTTEITTSNVTTTNTTAEHVYIQAK